MTGTASDDRGEVVLYRTTDGKTALDVRLAGDTVWLTQAQIAGLFAVNVPAISKHIKNIYVDRELARKATVSKMETVRMERKRRVTRTLEFYNLDLIISVGYRVNSARATRFRIWATQTLKEHLIRGYTLNERRLRETGLAEAEQAVQLLSRTLTRRDLVNEEGRGVLEVISRYARSWLLLKEYESLDEGVEEKAAHLLYFIIKDHPFSDRNKRIGSFLFILFLRENGDLQNASGEARINDNALVALVLLIAESEPRNKELMIRLVMNFLAEGDA